jgi:hypothetical protein
VGVDISRPLQKSFGKKVQGYLGAADYLTGASNSRKRSRDSPVSTGQPLDDDEEVEDAGEK